MLCYGRTRWTASVLETIQISPKHRLVMQLTRLDLVCYQQVTKVYNVSLSHFRDNIETTMKFLKYI